MVTPEGKAVLITGCDSGFGKELALRLNGLGYRVYATVLDLKSSESLCNECQNRDEMVVWKMNVTDDEDVTQVYHKVKQDLQTNDLKLWAVVNNAGYGIIGQLEWIKQDDINKLFDVNVFGVFRVTKQFLPLVRESKGRLVFVSSILAKEVLNGYGAYSMTKFAVSALATTLRREVSKFDIKVSVLYPGGFKNKFAQFSFASFERIWDQLDDNVKNEYANFETFKRRQQLSYDYLMSDNTCSVINDMVDAVTNSVPKSEYRPIGWAIGNFLALMLPFVPASLFDLMDSY